MDFMECHHHRQRKLQQMISVGHGERGKTPVESCTTRSLEDMSLLMTIAEDPCAMMPVVSSLQSYRDLLKEMVRRSRLQRSRHIGPAVKMEHMDDVVLLPMSVEGVAILLDG
jgi:uncharacterized radical SAM superfamily protein